MSSQVKMIRIAKCLQTLYPEIYKELNDRAVAHFTCTDLIPPMCEYYCLHYTNDEWQHKRLFIAVILQLYCPESLYLGFRVNNRVCSKLTITFGYRDKQSVSNMKGALSSIIKQPAFRKTVERIANDIKIRFSEEEFLQRV